MHNFEIIPGWKKQLPLCNRPICHNVGRVNFDSVVNSLGGDSSANRVNISGHTL